MEDFSSFEDAQRLCGKSQDIFCVSRPRNSSEIDEKISDEKVKSLEMDSRAVGGFA
jgi:hypothetical protein